MCILIMKPKNEKMPEMATLKNCWENNSDGAGFAYSDGRKLRLVKGLMSWESFEKALKEAGDLTKYPTMLHFRIATHGTVKPANTHPFNVNDRIVAGHNGILSITAEGDLTDSETFFKRVCNPMLKRFEMSSPEFAEVVESLIDSSKLAFLSDSGEVKMFGKFIEDDGVFYSNSSYLEYQIPKYSKYGYGSSFYDKYDYSQYDAYNKYSTSSFDSKHIVEGYKDNSEGIDEDLCYDIAFMYDDCVSFSMMDKDDALEYVASYFGITKSEVSAILSRYCY